ncbi:FAS1-like dehydratase domain-containing protein [Haloterrigena gelatinilytica]|uniref:FAS1-like dehydratase domain-containing protein n=1 Tax=Haloterrigena gelatinilytica TaxID=2741724 RepID=UPI0020C66318|nr:MaoC family dehydratase N-terminal domain-containing protein [Haloterrigena gelatinilytica]
MTRYFEGLESGDREYCGHHAIRERDIEEWVAKAESDCQQNTSENGELIAPKQYIRAICGRILLNTPQEIALKGVNEIEELEYHEQLRSGDVLSVTVRVVNIDPDQDGSHFPTVDITVTGRNQSGDEVITYFAKAIVEREE